jgi:hypothetical protein
VNKQRVHRFDTEKFNFEKFNDVEGKEKYPVEGVRRFAALKVWMLRWKLIVLGKRLRRI